MKITRKMFSKKEERKEVKLGKSKRGIGRVVVDGANYGPLGVVEGAVALGSGKKAADKAAKEGKSEAEIIDAAGKKAKKSMRAMEAGATALGLAGAGIVGKKAAKAIKENKDKIVEVAKDAAEKIKKNGAEQIKKSRPVGLSAEKIAASGAEIVNQAAERKSKAVRDVAAKIVKNPGKTGAAVAAGLGGAVAIVGAKRMFRRGRLAENAAHKNTIERIKDGKEKKEKSFSTKSKLLYVLAPGAYQAKEAAKYGYDNKEDYKEDRGKYAALGYFTPGTATYVKKKAEKMAKEGKSEKEIKEYLENPSTERIVAGIAEAATGSAGGLGHLAAHGVGLVDKLNGNRKKFDKKEDKKDEKKKSSKK